MDGETKKLIQEQYAKLPKQLQDAIQSSHVKEQIAAIAQTHKLHIDQLDPFENEVMLLMMGFTDPIEFIGEIKNTLSVDAETAQAVAIDVNHQILLPIREKMENGQPFEAPKAPSVPPAIANTPVAPAASAPMAGEKSVVMPSAAKATMPIADIKPLSSPASTMLMSTPATTPGQIPKPISAPPLTTSTPGKPSAIAPIVTTVAPTTPTAPKVDVMLTQPTVSAVSKSAAAPTAPATTPAPQPVVPPNPPSTPPPPPTEHAVDPYREPID